jgi:hypothetical protein
MTWKVERWGGNANHKRHVVFLGSEDKARERYREIYLALRQGSVELVDDQGRTVRRYGSGRGRSTGNIVELTTTV